MPLTSNEKIAGVVLSSIHLIQHLYFRLLPPLIPVLVLVLDLPLWQLGLLVSIYMFSGGICQAPMGILADKIDRLYLLIPALVLIPSGYLILGVAPILPVSNFSFTIGVYVFDGIFVIMAFGMFISGIGHSVIHPIGYPLITTNVREEYKGFLLGIWGSASKFGDALAPLLVGALILVLTWNQIVVFLGLLGLVYSVVVWQIMKSQNFTTRPAGNRLSRDEKADNEPLIRDGRTFVFPMLMILFFFFTIMFTTTGLVTYMPVFISEIYGYTIELFGVTLQPESVANLYFSLFLIGGAVAQIITGRWTDRYDHRIIMIYLLLFATGILLILSFVTLHPVLLLFICVLLGASIFGLNPARDALVSDITIDEFEGRTFGYLWTIVMIITSIYPVIIGYMADTIGIEGIFRYLIFGTIIATVFITALYSNRVYASRTTSA